MNTTVNNNNSCSRLRAFILEDREPLRVFMQKWLEEDGRHELVFFDTTEKMEGNSEPRHFELLAVHLLPGRAHFKRNGHHHPHCVYGENLDVGTIHWCRKNGVKGILDLRDRLEDWKQCLEYVGNGHTSETPSVTKSLAHGNGKGVAKLSRRETEVARMLVKGFSAKQVAAALGTSEGTVKNQRKAVYKKLGIVRATQLAGAMGFKTR